MGCDELIIVGISGALWLVAVFSIRVSTEGHSPALWELQVEILVHLPTGQEFLIKV